MYIRTSISAGWLSAMNSDPVSHNKPKKVLLQVALGDGQVSSLAGEFMVKI